MNAKFNTILVEVVGRRVQRQDGLNDQIKDLDSFREKHDLADLNSDELQILATRLGMYDAADHLKAVESKH